MCCLCDACKWRWRPLGITTKKGVNAGCINFTQLAVQWKYTLAHWPRFCVPFCQYCLRMAVMITKSFGISITNRILEGRNNKYKELHGLEAIQVGVMFLEFSNHQEKSCDFSFTVHSTKWKKTDEDSVIYRRIPKFADECLRFPKKSRRCFDHISYISQGPGSRVQSPVLLLDYARVHQLWFRFVLRQMENSAICEMTLKT